MGLLESLGVAGSVGSGVFAARGARTAGRAAGRSSEINAQLAEQEGFRAAARTRRMARQEIGSQRAALAASGLAPEGSPLELIAANAAELERQAMEQQIAGLHAGRLERSRGRVARKEGKRASAAELLRGGVQAAFFARRLS